MGGVLLALTVPLLVTCDLLSYSRPIPDAYYSQNLLSSAGFSVFTGAGPVPADPLVPDAASWDFAYRYTDWDGYGYLGLTDTGATAASFAAVPEGLAADAAVYRLEVVNLISDGDFHLATGGTWVDEDNSSAVRDTFGTTPRMRLSAGSNTSVYYRPSLIGGFVPPANGAFRLSFAGESTSFDPILIFGTGGIEFDAGTRTTAIITPVTTAPYLQLEFTPRTSSNFTDLYVDDFTLSYNTGMRLRLLLASADTDPPLIGGRYRFTIWVCEDPAAFPDRSPYNLDRLRTTMLKTGQSYLEAGNDEYAFVAGSPSWKRLSVNLDAHALQFDPTDLPVIELSLDLSESRPGRILLASPELRFYD